MSHYFNDSPIEISADDRYGIAPFAHSLAKSILTIRAPEGTTLALHGPWGSGKSSAVNLIRSALAESSSADDLIVTEFKGWWYRGDEALTLAFLQNLNSTLEKGLGDKIKGYVPKLARRLLQGGPAIGAAAAVATGQPWLSAVVSKTTDFARTFFSDESLSDTYKALADLLRKSPKRFLVIIDDIDRLLPDETLAVFRLVKSVGRLPNVMYLLVFDRLLADKLVQAQYPSEGPHFLEKIIQAGFELPPPLQSDLNDAVLESIQKICGAPDDGEAVRFMNLFYDVVAPYITTPRHVARFQNAISITWPPIAGEISKADFVALEGIRLYEPTLFAAIRQNKEKLCGASDKGRRDHDQRLDVFLRNVPEDRRDDGRAALQRLFPRMEDMGYGSDFIESWSAERRVCVEAYFDIYFRMMLGDDALPRKEIDELITRAGDSEFVQQTFINAASRTRKNGKSYVPVYLSELTTHADKVEKGHVETLLTTLFQIHDGIDLERDDEKGVWAIANTSLRYHWLIRRLTRTRFTLDERTKLYLNATQHASLGWLVDFADSAYTDYYPREGNSPALEQDCLIASEAVSALTERSLTALRAAAANGTLLKHRDLVYLLYRWRGLLGNDATEVRTWTDSLLEGDDELMRLLEAFTGQSWSYGMGGFGGMGDRVAKSTMRVRIDDQTDIIDVENFRGALRKLQFKSFGTDTDAMIERRRKIKTFLDAWDRQREGRDDD